MDISKLNIPGLVVAFCIVIIIVASLYYWVTQGSKKGAGSNSQDSIDAADEEYKALMEKYGKNKPYGKTDKYEWTQTENEVELYIPGSAELNSKMVKVQMKTDSLEVRINNIVIVKGEFPSTIQPDDSCWVIDSSNDGKKHVWITLFKTSPGIWRHIINEDAGDNVHSSLPPVHALDPTNPNSIKQALKAVSK